MKLKIVPWWHRHPAICICGHNFGYCTAFTSPDPRKSFIQVKREHFMTRHPRRWAQGGIA